MKNHTLPKLFNDFEDFFSFFTPPITKQSCCSAPSFGIAISEDEENLYIDAPIPGVEPEKVEISLDPEKKELTILGSATNARKEAKIYSKKAESFCYKVPLGHGLRLDEEIEATINHGVLTVTLGKSQASKPLKIPVKTA